MTSARPLAAWSQALARAAGSFDGARAWRSAGMAVYVALAYGPVIVLFGAAAQLLVNSPATAARLVPTARTLPILMRSVAFAATVSMAAVALAVLIVTASWGRHGGRALQMRWAVLALAGVPPYVHALAWSSLMTLLGAWSMGGQLGWLGVRIQFTGLSAAAWVSTLAYLPLAVVLAMMACEHVPRSLREVAQLDRSDGAVLARIVLPLAVPALVMAGALLFLITILDYSVTSLYQVTLYALEVFVAFSQSNEAAAALLSAVPLMVVCGVVVAAMARALPRAMMAPDRGTVGGGWWPRWPVPMRAAQALAVGLLVAATGVPLFSLIRLASLSTAALQTVVQAGDEITYSLAVALSAAVLALPPALAAASWMHARRPSAIAWFALCLPLAFPSSLIGIGLITAFNTPFLPLHGTAIMPVLAVVARFAPLMALVLFAQRVRLDATLVDAARVLQGSTWHGWRRVVLPMMLPGVVAAASVGFVLTLGELGATLIVAPPGRATLTMRIYTYLHFGASDSVAVLCLILVVVALVGGVIAAVALGAVAGDRSAADARPAGGERMVNDASRGLAP